MRIFVGNLPFDTTDPQLAEIFMPFGHVADAVHIADRKTRRPKGYGFVEMPNPEEAKAAIEGLKRYDYRGRYINVSEARPHEHQQRTPRPVQPHWTDRD